MEGFGTGAQAPPEAQPQQGQGFEQGQKQATPEQQKAYDKFYYMSIATLYDEKFVEKAVKMLKAPTGPVHGMANVATAIATRLVTQAKNEGITIEGIVMIEAGWEAMQEVGQLAQRIGLQVSEDDVETAFYLASDQIRTALVDAGVIEWDEQEAQKIAQMVDDPEEARRKAEKVNAVRHHVQEVAKGKRK